MMYYVSIFTAILFATMVARVLVAFAGRLPNRFARGATFWGLIFPISLIACVGIYVYSAGDDGYLSSEPSYVIWLGSMLVAGMLALIGLGVVGLRSDVDSGNAKAGAWSIRRAIAMAPIACLLLIASLFFYDVQLKHRLARLKSAELEQWKLDAAPEVAPEIRADKFAPLRDAKDLIDAFPDSLFQKRLRQVNLADPQFAQLDQDLGGAFALIRDDADAVSETLASVNFNTRSDWMSDHPDRERLKKLLFLYSIQALGQAQRGELDAAIDDQRKLRQFAMIFRGSASFPWSEVGSYAFGLFTDSLERMLVMDPNASNLNLGEFVDDSISLRRVHPEVFASAGAFFIADNCDYYLGRVDGDATGDAIVEKLNTLPGPVRSLLFAHLRIRRVRDELIAMERASEMFDDFSQNFEDPTMTSQRLVTRRIDNWTQGHLARFDPRDIIYYRANQFHGRQQILNAAIAATDFRRDRGSYPDRLEQLVPDYLPSIPTDLDDGKPIHLLPFQGGLILCGNSDESRMRYRDVESFDREFAGSLSSGFFLGSAYSYFFDTPPASENSDDDGALDTMFESDGPF